MKWKMLICLIFPLFLMGCMSGVRHIGGSSFDIPPEKLHGGLPGVDVIEITTYNALGQEITTQAICFYDGHGKTRIKYVSQGGDGIIKSMAPGTPGALAYWESFEGDEIHVEGGSAESSAEGGRGGRGGDGGNADATSRSSSLSLSSSESSSSSSSSSSTRVLDAKKIPPPVTHPPPKKKYKQPGD